MASVVHLALADSLAFLAIADRVHPAFLVSQAIPVLMASRKAVLADTADSQDFQDQVLADILAAAFLAIPAAVYRVFQAFLDILALVCRATAASLAIQDRGFPATAVNKEFLAILDQVYPVIAAIVVLEFLAIVAYPVTVAAAYLATLAAAYPVTAEFPVTVAAACLDILDNQATLGQALAVIRADQVIAVVVYRVTPVKAAIPGQEFLDILDQAFLDIVVCLGTLV